MINRSIVLPCILAVVFLTQVQCQSKQQQQQSQTPTNIDGQDMNQSSLLSGNQNNAQYGPVQGIVNPFLDAMNHFSYGIFELLKKGFEMPVSLLHTGQTSMTNILNSFQRPTFQPPTPKPVDLDQIFNLLSQLRPDVGNPAQQPPKSSPPKNTPQKPTSG